MAPACRREADRRVMEEAALCDFRKGVGAFVGGALRLGKLSLPYELGPTLTNRKSLASVSSTLDHRVCR